MEFDQEIENFKTVIGVNVYPTLSFKIEKNIYMSYVYLRILKVSKVSDKDN